MNSITIVVPGMPAVALRKNRGSTGPWDRRREAKEANEDALMLVREALQGKGQVQFLAATIDIVCYYWGKPLDYDGLASGMGPTIDAFVDLAVIPDDSPKYILAYRMRAEKADSKDAARVAVTVSRA